jgi:hypothetical protein
MRALTKKQRNALYDRIVTAGLDPARCDFADDEQGVRLTHNLTGSIFSAQLHKYEGYTVRKSTGDEPAEQFFEPAWSAVIGSAGVWAESVEEFMKAPDLWAELRREKKFLSADEFESANNAPFSPAEQSRIAAQLREVKDYLADRYPLSDEEISDVEVRLDEVAAAARRAGRRDWLLMFYGVMFTLIITALLPPETVQRIMAMVSHGLGDLFGFGQASPAA